MLFGGLCWYSFVSIFSNPLFPTGLGSNMVKLVFLMLEGNGSFLVSCRIFRSFSAP